MLEMYVLKHKDEKCGLVSIETGDGSLDEYVSANKSNAPFLGNDTRELMKMVDDKMRPRNEKSHARSDTPFRMWFCGRIPCQEPGAEHDGLLLDLPHRCRPEMG